MRGSDEVKSGKERGKVWKDYVERITNEENYWDHNVEGDVVEDPVVCVGREEVLQALYENKKSSWTLRCIIRDVCCEGGCRNSSDGGNISQSQMDLECQLNGLLV